MSVSKPPVEPIAPAGEAVCRRPSNGADSKEFTAGIRRYDDKQGRCGRLLGLITFTDGKSLKVWDPELHEQCLKLAPLCTRMIVEVQYESRHSAKWGDSLTSIRTTKPEHELYDDLRGVDEQRGRLAPNTWLGRQIAKGVSRVDAFDQVRRG